MAKYRINEEQFPEFLGQLVDAVEDMLSEYNSDGKCDVVSLPRSEEAKKEDPDIGSDVVIAGPDYDELADRFTDVLRNWEDPADKSATAGEAKPLVLLIGKSGSGKTTLAEKLKEMYGWTDIQSYTDRPKRRPDETGHTFVSKAEFDKLRPEMVAYNCFNGHQYGATVKQLDAADVYVVDIPGYLDLVEQYPHPERLVPVYLNVPGTIRKQRMLERGDSPEAAKSRLEYDEAAFADIRFIPHVELDAVSMSPEEEARFIHCMAMQWEPGHKRTCAGSAAKSDSGAAAQLSDIDHAFWSVVDILSDNMPDTYDADPDMEEYCNECSEQYDNAVREYKEAYKKLSTILK